MKRLALLTAAALVASSAPYVWSAVGVDSKALRKAVTATNMVKHLQALQDVADANNGDRASGTQGFEDSAAYVKQTLEAAGYTVRELPFSFPFFQELSAPEFSQTFPAQQTYLEPDDFGTMEYSGTAALSDRVVQNAGGIVLPPTTDPSSTSGCTAADFAGFVPGNVALIQRGGCTFAEKAAAALAAGASGVIIFNEGNPGRTDAFGGTLGGEISASLPVLSASFAVGSALVAAQPAPARVSIKTNTSVEIKNTKNLLAETAKGRTDRVVVAGAHLDSVPGGAGIQDNGSGSAGILEIALQMKKLGITPRNKVRFMWFGAEEAGLLGSENYVASLTTTQKKRISVNLNFDMIASPNFVRYVYDGDGSSTPDAGPNGSATIEQVFAKYFNSQGLPFEPTAFDGRSDYGPFIDAGIPAGGLFTGAEELKTASEQAIYGGTVGVAYDHCYHQACDTIDNLNTEVYEEMGDAAADAILQFAMTTSAVRGTSKANDQAVKAVDIDSRLYRGTHLQK
jgi:Zn-dependent M28 family amino/carboxypeptidase